jgi:hypothetical protein
MGFVDHLRGFITARRLVMAQQGEDKQVPLDQRARGKNPEHTEGQDNIRNEKQQKAAQPAPPAPTTGG